MSAYAEESLAECQGRWMGWASVGLQRLPLPYPLLTAAAGLIVFAEQVLEYSLRDPAFAYATPLTWIKRLVVPFLIVYILLTLRVLRRGAVKALAALRPIVEIDDDAYDAHVRAMVHIRRREELLLLGVSAALMVLLFIVMRNPLPLSGGPNPVRLPTNWLLAAFILSAYTLLGWLFFMLIYCSIRLGTALGRLAREPLSVNIFDPMDLLPFGRLSLLHSLSLVGVILILVLPLGRPTELVDYLVILLASLGSFLALVVPLWGVHRQMDEAKERALANIHEQLHDIHRRLVGSADLAGQDVASLANRTGALINLRKMISEAPSWPFKDATAALRASLAAMTPLIYFVLTEIIRVYLLPFLGR